MRQHPQIITRPTQQRLAMPQHQRGFTLYELVIGMLVLAIAMTMLSLVLFPAARRGAEPMVQMQAAELANALMDEIRSRPFDANSVAVSAYGLRCGELLNIDENSQECTPSSDFGAQIGAQRKSRIDFSDVDDYHGYNTEDEGVFSDALGADISDHYSGFSYRIHVCYVADDFLACEAAPRSRTNYKKITITVTSPLGQEFIFASIKGNY